MLDVKAGPLFVGRALSEMHPVGKRQVGVILNALFPLESGAHHAAPTAGDGSSPARLVVRVNDDYARPGIVGIDGCSYSGPASTHDHHVGISSLVHCALLPVRNLSASTESVEPPSIKLDAIGGADICQC